MFLNDYLISICQPGNSSFLNHFFNHCVTLSNLDYSQSVTITALENRGEYKFPLTELIMQWTLLDELIRNLSLDC